MSLIGNFKNLVIGIVLALVVGFGCGYYAKGEFAKADTVDAVATARHGTAIGIEQSLTQSHAVESQVTASNLQVTKIQKRVAEHIQKQEEARHEENTDSACRWTLDDWTVRMLNAARSSAAAPDAAVSGDGTSEGTAPVGKAELIDNDLEVVKLYRELAERHDSLVDYVETLIKKQAE